ncbi:hypothetical protein VPH35_139370 [Triticum aestivum]
MLSRPQGEIPFPTNPSIYPFSLTLHAHFLTPFPTFRPSPVVAAPARVSRPRPPASPPAPSAMSKQGGKAKPLKQAKVAEKDYDEVCCRSPFAGAPDSSICPCNSRFGDV